jgi:branched-chain amino acid transport system substrate-binding protein
MTNDTPPDHQTHVPQKKLSIGAPVSSPPENTSLSAGLTKRAGKRNLIPIRSRRLFIVASLLALALVVGLLPLISLLPKPASAPLTLAMVATLSGSQASQGQEALRGTQLYLNAVNQAGGVNGHQLQLHVYNDQFDATHANSVAHQVIASPSLLVLGPIYSATTLPVNHIYSAAHLPLITASVSSDLLTRNNPFAFRLRTLTSSQGTTSAVYVRKILGLGTASIVYADESAYGVPISQAFQQTFIQQGGHIAHMLPLAQDLRTYQKTLETIVTTLVRDPHPGMVFLAMTDVHKAAQVIVELRRHGVSTPILCTDAIDSDLFPATFASYPEEQRQPGYFSDGIYASAPVIYDSAPDEAQAFATRYQQTYGSAFGWFGAKYYEAAQVAVAALQAANVRATSTSLSADRAEIVRRLAMMNSPQMGVEGLDGPLYFDLHHDGASPIRFGQFLHRRLHSLPIQLMAVSDSALGNLSNQQRTEEIIQVGKQSFWKQRVVYAGIDVNKISSINVTTSTFTADFYLWMRYSGADDATAIAFTNASSVSFDPTTPQISQIIYGLHYRLYHVTGDFKAIYDFHEYPFDQQRLTIGFQNTHLTSDHLVYVIDALGLRLRIDNTADPTLTTVSFQSLSSWMYQGTQYASDTFTSHSTLGDPRLFDQRTQTDYSGLQMTMTIQRKSLAYLISHLLPMVLLFFLVFASLFLPLKHLGDRLTLTVSALLTSAVLLLSVNSELPEIGYVVSLDSIYYIFFGLCLVCIMVSIVIEWLHERGRACATRWISNGLRVTYLVIVIATIIYYLVTYSNRFV